jgi:hypothetical protein
MGSTPSQAGTSTNWPPEQGQIITFKSVNGLSTGVVEEVRWGLVWRDFILDDGRVIPEHKILDHPEPPVWRKAEEVTAEEREAVGFHGRGRIGSTRPGAVFLGRVEPVSRVHLSTVQASGAETFAS